MLEIKLYKSQRKAIRLLILSILFVAIGIWLVSTNESNLKHSIIGILCCCFFSLGVLVAFINLFDKRPQLIINETGIWDRTTKQDIINWEGINDAYPLNIYGQKFISLVLKDNVKIKDIKYKWAYKLTQIVGGQKVNLALGQVKVDPYEILELVNTMARADLSLKRQLLRIYIEKHNIS